ncbi:MAG: RluA family pseudouridine synthase [Candidatus Melainabacteria bacterium]
MHHISVDEDATATRLDRFLADWAETEGHAFSRERIQGLIKQGEVRVNDQPVLKPAAGLQEGDVITLHLPQAVPLNLPAETLPIDIVHEDDALLVVSKPAGMLTHPTGRVLTGTLVNALLAHCGDRLSGINGVIRPGIVHRLDRDTSGLLAVAKTDAAHHHLSAQLKARTVHRHYVAIVQGVPDKSSGTVNAPIARNPRQRDLMMVHPQGRPATTHWQVVETIGQKFAKLHLQLETGRTHQIRVHMRHIRHPILGDPAYGSGVENLLRLTEKRQLLQAFHLEFIHPVTLQPVSFDIPEDPTIRQTWAMLNNR